MCVKVAHHLCLCAACVCVCQERELPMLPGTTVRVNSPRRNVGEQLRQSNLRVDDEGKQTIDCKHPKWEFPVTAKVRTANC